MKLRSLLFIVLLVSFAATGCLFSPEDDPDPIVTPPPTLPTPLTADQLVTNFKTAYNEQSIENYREVLSTDYRFIAKNNTDDYNYDQDIAIHQQMFTGAQGAGGIAFEDIVVNSLVALETWQPVPANDPHFGGFANSYYSPHDVSIDFNVSGQALTYQVRGLVVFYVSTQEIDGQDVYFLLGQTDNTEGS